MTRNQYVKKVRQLQWNIRAYAKKEGLPVQKCSPDRVLVPHFGEIITVGSQKGKKLRSYAQCWDCLCETLAGTDFLKGIE